MARPGMAPRTCTIGGVTFEAQRVKAKTTVNLRRREWGSVGSRETGPIIPAGTEVELLGWVAGELVDGISEWWIGTSGSRAVGGWLRCGAQAGGELRRAARGGARARARERARLLSAPRRGDRRARPQDHGQAARPTSASGRAPAPIRSARCARARSGSSSIGRWARRCRCSMAGPRSRSGTRRTCTPARACGAGSATSGLTSGRGRRCGHRGSTRR